MTTGNAPPRIKREFFDWFVPAADRADARRTARAKAVVRSLLSISAVVALLLGAFLVARREPSVVELALFGVGLATPVVAACAVRFARSAVWVLAITNLVGIASVAAWAWVTGGVLSVAMPWLVALLVSLGTFGNSVVIVLAFAADALVLVLLYVATVKDLLPPSVIPAAEQATLAFLGQFSSMVIVALATVIVLRARVRANDAIRRSEHRLRNVVDGVPAVIAYTDRSGDEPRYAFVNNRFAQRFGKTPADIVGKTVREVIGEHAYGHLLSHMNRVTAGETVEYDREFALPDGTTRYDRVYMMPDLDSGGLVQGTYVFGIDDTERKHALIDLEASRERLAEAQAIAHVGNWEFDLVTDRLEWSDEVYRIYGHAPGSFTPRFRTDYLPATHADDRQKLLDALAHVLETRAPHAIEHRIMLPSGGERVVEVRAQLPRADMAGTIVRLVGVVQDITERRRADAELRRQTRLMQVILDAMPGPVAHVGLDERYTFVNRAFELAFGIPAERVIGRTVREVLGDELYELTRKYSEPVRRGESVRFERQQTVADGTVRHFSVRYMPDLDERGEVLGLVSLTLDTTDRKEIEAALARAKDVAESASRAKSAFLANMSHEVRTPMNGVIGMAELLLQEPLGDKVRRYAETIQRSGRALLGVLDDVLDLSKIEAGRLRLEVAPLDVRALVLEMKDLYGEAARAKGVRLSLEVSPEMAPWRMGDALRLRQVLLNLVSNAVKFTQQGSIVVSVSGDVGGALRFDVKDTGIGIAQNQQARIFDAFAQAEDGANRRYGGTGLGLSISREIVRRMGGTMGVRSVPGEGALFWCSVPLPEAPAPAPVAAQGVSAGGAMAGNPLAGRRVLVVEDEPVNAEVTRAMLRRLGVDVVMASDGEQAVAEVGRQAFDLILMDCQMPVMDGLEATRRIRGAETAGGAVRTPIVALTAHVLPEHRRECIEAGMDDYLSKPFTAAALEQVVARSALRVTQS